MTQPCAACAAALLDPDAGLVHASCRGCAVRSVSSSPEWAQRDYYGRIRDDARRAAFQADVEAETLRREALRRSRCPTS